MKVKKLKEEDGFIWVSIEADPDLLKGHYHSHFNKTIKGVSVPGFRKGHAPFEMAVQYMKNRGKFAPELNVVLGQVIEKSALKIPEKDKKLDKEIFGLPVDSTVDELDLDKWQLRFSSKFEKFPTVTIGDYSTIETLIEHKEPDPDSCPMPAPDKEIEEKDVVAISMVGKDPEGNVVYKYTYDMLEIDLEKTKLKKEITKPLIGAKIRDKREVKIKVKDKEITLEMLVIDVRKRETVDQALVEKLKAPNLTSVEQLKEAMEKQHKVHNSYVRYQDILKWLASSVHTVDPLPRENLRREASKLYHSLTKRGRNVSFEALFYESCRNLKVSLVLDEIAKKEKLNEPNDDDRADFIRDIDEHPWLYGNRKSEDILNAEEEVVKEYLIQHKTMAFLMGKWRFKP